MILTDLLSLCAS